jgi:hypothetical protein
LMYAPRDHVVCFTHPCFVAETKDGCGIIVRWHLLAVTALFLFILSHEFLVLIHNVF